MCPNITKKKVKTAFTKKKASANRRKSALILSRLHRKIKNRRKDFLHKVSTHLAKTKQVIVVEDLNIAGMIKNHYLSRNIADSGWSQFLWMLSYKTNWYGSELIKAPQFYPSSKTCSVCGAIKVDFGLSERQFTCGMCDLIIDRHKNAARNLTYLSPYQKVWSEDSFTGSSPGSYACGPRTFAKVRGGDTSGGGIPIKRESTSHVSKKQEADTKYSPGIFG